MNIKAGMQRGRLLLHENKNIENKNKPRVGA